MDTPRRLSPALLSLFLILPAAAIVFFLAFGSSDYLRKKREKETRMYEVNLYSGIPDIVRLGENEPQFIARSKTLKRTKHERRETAAAEKVSYSHMYSLDDVGIRVYFRNNRVALVELQDPFRGSIHGRKIKLFSLAPPEGTSWEELLIREFGMPQARASGGKLGSEALFYFWGDISYNRMGPNELALYRDHDIYQYRLNNFGRNVTFFK